MFMGEYNPSLDEKGRVAVPIKLRKAFGGDALIDKLIITHGFDKCIMAFREEEWQIFVKEKLLSLSQAESKNRMRLRFLLGGASECDLDKQGRILIPGYLIDYAEIESDITIIGVYDRIEVWSTRLYQSYKPDGDALDSFASDLGF
jgi:MraZ protein